MKQSAGALLYRWVNDDTPAKGQTHEAEHSPVASRKRERLVLHVLLVHPSGSYNRHKPWSIPKGLPDAGETLEQAARRETQEEAGVTAGDLTPLGSIVYTKSRKQVHAFAGPAPDEQPRPACWEIDRAEFLPIDDARQLLHPEQTPFLDRLLELLAGKQSGSDG